MLRVDERNAGEVMILTLAGRIKDGADELALGDKVRSLLHQGFRKLLLDLGEVATSNACGVNALLGALIDARAAGAEMKLLRLTRRAANVQVIVALALHFAAFDSEVEALASFGEERRIRPCQETAHKVWASVTAA